jgi:hypothetical protein
MAGLPQLFDEDDLPDPFYDPNYVHVLTEVEQKDLHRRESEFPKSDLRVKSNSSRSSACRGTSSRLIFITYSN